MRPSWVVAFGARLAAPPRQPGQSPGRWSIRAAARSAVTTVISGLWCGPTTVHGRAGEAADVGRQGGGSR
eukprot:gene17739-54667_t